MGEIFHKLTAKSTERLFGTNPHKTYIILIFRILTIQFEMRLGKAALLAAFLFK